MLELKFPGEGESQFVLKVPAALSDVGDETNLVQVQASAGVWAGRPVDMQLTTEELTTFFSDLVQLVESQSGDAHLETSSGDIDVQIEAATKGRFVIAGYISTGSDNQVTLEFAFESEAKRLQPLVESIRTLI